MNKQEASRILHPDTTAQAMAGYLLDDPSGDTWAQALNKACEMGAEALRGPQPDPITGLMPCGCGGEVYPHYQLGWYHEESGVQAFEVSTGCDKCGTYTKPRYGHYVNGEDENDTESASKRDWNTSHGYTDPPLPEVLHDNS